MRHPYFFDFFFFNDTATTEIYTLSLHDALPISVPAAADDRRALARAPVRHGLPTRGHPPAWLCVGSPCRSEEHTSELQSHLNLVCRLLLEKKKKRRSNVRSS